MGCRISSGAPDLTRKTDRGSALHTAARPAQRIDMIGHRDGLACGAGMFDLEGLALLVVSQMVLGRLAPGEALPGLFTPVRERGDQMGTALVVLPYRDRRDCLPGRALEGHMPGITDSPGDLVCDLKNLTRPRMTRHRQLGEFAHPLCGHGIKAAIEPIGDVIASADEETILPLAREEAARVRLDEQDRRRGRHVGLPVRAEIYHPSGPIQVARHMGGVQALLLIDGLAVPQNAAAGGHCDLFHVGISPCCRREMAPELARRHPATLRPQPGVAISPLAKMANNGLVIPLPLLEKGPLTMDRSDEMRKTLLAKREAMIDKYGWTAIHVFPTDEHPGLPFTYSIGLESTFGSPEVVMVGFDPQLAHGVMHSYVAALREKRIASPVDGGRVAGVIQDLDVVLSPVPEDLARALARGAFDRAFPKGVRLLQLILPDAEGRLPSDPDCDPAYRDAQDIQATES